MASSSAKPLRPLSSLRAPQPPSFDRDQAGCFNAPKKEDDDANVFSKLMTSYKENEAWKEASTVEDRNFRPTKANGGRRKAPFYKVMQGMPIAVDAFRYGAIPNVTAYFLTYVPSHSSEGVRALTLLVVLLDMHILITTRTCRPSGTVALSIVRREQRISSSICWASSRSGSIHSRWTSRQRYRTLAECRSPS